MWALSFLAVPLAVLSLVFGAGAPALAAGSAELSVSVVAVNPTTGAPITTLAPGQSVAFEVDFACDSAECDNATVQFDPTQLDPNYNTYRLLTESGFIPPSTGGSVSGSATAGYTVSLGNLPAGTSGQFILQYSLNPSGCGDWNVTRDGDRENCPTSNFPNGFQLTQTVQISSTTAIASKTASTDPVTWQIPTPTPAVNDGGLYDANGNGVAAGGVLATDTPYTFQAGYSSGCVSERLTAYRVVDPNGTLCASGYTVTQQLPPGAELVSADGNPTVSGSVATGLILTWTGPPWAPTGDTSQIGWGSNYWGSATAADPHNVTIEFPRANLAPPGQTCNYTASTSGLSISASTTYISLPGQAGTVKSASESASKGYTVQCLDPFGKAVMDPKSTTYDGNTPIDANTSPITIPAAGSVNDKQWQVTVGNQANVNGVAVVTDDQLDQPDAPVYEISAPAGSTITWTETDGTTTKSGTSTTTANADAGFRFVTSTVTSPPLPGPNQQQTGTTRTNFTVDYLYQVSSTAPPGETRTNTASAVMTYPDYPQLASIPLGPQSHSIRFEGPFSAGSFQKTAQDGNIDGPPVTQEGIPGTGANRGFWVVDVLNSGNTQAVPVVSDPSLDPALPVYEIGLRGGQSSGTDPNSLGSWTGTIHYTLSNGTTGTAQNNFTAPAGTWITAATITGDPMPAGASFPGAGTSSIFKVLFYFNVNANAIPDSVVPNTATAQLQYPAYGLPTDDLGSSSAQVTLVGTPPVITASMGAPVIAGGATQATPTTNVTFTVGGSTSNVAANRIFTPQYVFVAPPNWNITPGSASFPAGSVPPGVTFAYRTVTINGVARQEVVATWPAGTVFGQNKTLPTMSVIARPSSSAAAGSAGVASGFIGNSGDVEPGDTFTNPFTDAPDLDGDGAVAELFSQAPAPAGIPVAAIGAMQVLKEICLPDASQPDGCHWIADPNDQVGVPPNSASIKYRITVTNTGNTTLSDVVGYDVLPYIGDTGTSTATLNDPRGSTFRESIAAVTTPSNGGTASFSASTQPCRPEVASVAGCVNDWSTTSSGAQAIRLTRPGALAPGDSVSMEYTAAVDDAPANGAVACNSFAVHVTGLANTSEPAPVCATVQETDLQVTAGTPKLQEGRPGVLPWTVTNLGGAASTSGDVAVQIPAGLEATSFTPTGWTCTATDGSGNPVYGTAVGPATLSCKPNNPLLLNVPQALNIPVVPTASTAMTMHAEVQGLLFDQNLANNDAAMAVNPQDAAATTWVSKDDGVTSAKPGDTLTYTITAKNPLDFETITGASLTDQLPAGVQFVSASNGGTQANGTVTWSLPDLAGGATVIRTVTVKVLSTVGTATLMNTATVSAPDPGFPGEVLTDSADDVDTVVTNPAIAVVKATTSAQVTEAGQQIPYTFTVTNTGDVTLTGIQVDDQLAAPSQAADLSALSCPDTTLAPAASTVCTATYTVTQADVDAGTVNDTAHVSGSSPAGVAVTGQSSVAVPVVQDPEITIVKSSPDLTTPITAAGQVVHYQFLVTNTGNVTLSNVQVADHVTGASSQANVHVDACSPATLAPGEAVTCTGTYTVTQADVDAGSASDEATASGTTASGATITSGPSDLTVPGNAEPALTVAKASTTAQVTQVGQQVPYTFTVTNTGNVTLSGVAVADQVTTPSAQSGLSAVSCPATPLIPGQSLACTASYTTTQADLDHGKVADTATASGVQPATPDDPAPVPTLSTPDSLSIPAAADPELKVVKTADATEVTTVGQQVTYTFTVTNTGNVTETDIQVSDTVVAPSLQSELSALDCGTGPITLASGQSAQCTASYTVTQDDLDHGTVDDTATASGTDPAGATVTADPAALSVPVAQDAELSVMKESETTLVRTVGQQVDYTFTVTNTGNVTLSGVTVADQVAAPSQQSGLSAVDCDPGSLAPGDSMTCTASYTVTQADIDAGAIVDTATASATPPATAASPDPSPVVSIPDSLRIPAEQDASLAVVKASDTTQVTQLGQKVPYTFTVTNTGNVTLTGIQVDDRVAAPSTQADLSAVACPSGSLAPGASVTCSATYTVTQADLDAGVVDDQATASATPPVTAADPDPAPVPSAESAVSIPVTQHADLNVVKAAPGTDAATMAGQHIDYTFTVTNTGNVTVSNLSVDDEVAAPSVETGLSAVSCPTATLSPGASVVCTAVYTVTAADLGSGHVADAATAVGLGPDGVSVAAPPSKLELPAVDPAVALPVVSG